MWRLIILLAATSVALIFFFIWFPQFAPTALHCGLIITVDLRPTNLSFDLSCVLCDLGGEKKLAWEDLEVADEELDA